MLSLADILSNARSIHRHECWGIVRWESLGGLSQRDMREIQTDRQADRRGRRRSDKWNSLVDMSVGRIGRGRQT